MLSTHEATIRSISLAMAFGSDAIMLTTRGTDAFVARFQRDLKTVRDARTEMDFPSPFFWARFCMRTEKISTSKFLLIRDLTVKQWMTKMRKDKELRKAFEEARRELLGDKMIFFFPIHTPFKFSNLFQT